MKSLSGLREMTSLVVITLAILPTFLLSQACQPPSIVEQGRKVLYSPFYRTLRFPCVANGSSPLTYLWTKNGIPFNTSEVSTTEESGTFLISSADTSDQGHYQCRVMNPCGTSVAVTTQVILAFMDPFPDMTGPRFVTATVGGTVSLRCIPPRSVPPASIVWVYIEDPSAFDSYPQLVNSDNRTIMDYSDTLRITQVRHEDAKLYVCVASNPVTLSLYMGQHTRLVVHGNGALFPTQLMWASPQHIIALEGDSAKMKCVFSGNPLPTTTWERLGGQLDTPRVYQDHHELEIRDVRSSDSGQYECSGQGPMDSHQLRHTFTVVVQAAPQWQSEPTDITTTAGESAQFECSATGIPQPTVKWFINGESYQNLSDDPNRTLNGTTLTFANLDVSDSQVIQCNASNIHGYLWADVYLAVQE